MQKVSYATSLMRQGVLISTTEHLLSVFYSMSVDNAFVEIDNLEVPILDGSGQPFVDLIRSAGIKYHRKRRQLSAHPQAGFGGGRRQAHHHRAVGPFPADLRRVLRSSAGGPAGAAKWK